MLRITAMLKDFQLNFDLLIDELTLSSGTLLFNEEFIVDFMMVNCPGSNAAKQTITFLLSRSTIGVRFFW